MEKSFKVKHSCGHEKPTAVLVFEIACMEGPPQAHAFYNGQWSLLQGKSTKDIELANLIHPNF